MVAIECARMTEFVCRHVRSGKFELRADMCHDAGMDVAGCWETPEVSPRLEQHREQQAACVGARVRADEVDFGLGQVVADTQLLAGQPRTRTRVGGAVDGCHRVSGKGCATGVARSARFEGLGR